MRAEIAVGERSGHRINEGMAQNIAIGVSDKADFGINLDTA